MGHPPSLGSCAQAARWLLAVAALAATAAAVAATTPGGAPVAPGLFDRFGGCRADR
jgi:hypothetical protein